MAARAAAADAGGSAGPSLPRDRAWPRRAPDLPWRLTATWPVADCKALRSMRHSLTPDRQVLSAAKPAGCAAPHQGDCMLSASREERP